MNHPAAADEDERDRRRFAWWFWWLLVIAILAVSIPLTLWGNDATRRQSGAPDRTDGAPAQQLPPPETGPTDVSAQGSGSSTTGCFGCVGAQALAVSGRVLGLVGIAHPATLLVTVTNRSSGTITLNRVVGALTGVGSVGDAAHPVCDRRWYSVGSSQAPVRLQRGASAQIPLPVILRDLPVNQDNCKGAVYTFRVSASGQQV